jgi:hypothetical protein
MKKLEHEKEILDEQLKYYEKLARYAKKKKRRDQSLEVSDDEGQAEAGEREDGEAQLEQTNQFGETKRKGFLPAGGAKPAAKLGGKEVSDVKATPKAGERQISLKQHEESIHGQSSLPNYSQEGFEYN